MAIPFLYSSNDSTNDYLKNGLGALPDCTVLLTTSSLNGEVILQGSVAIGKNNVDNVINSNIIKLKINDTQQPQIMRLFNVKKSMATGLVTFSAEPIANDIREYFLPNFDEPSKSAVVMFDALRSKSKPAIPTRFKFYSDKENNAAIKLERVSALQALGGIEGSFLQKFKGEYEKDNHDIHLHKRLGEDHKIKILYTKNLNGLDIEVDTQGLVNGIYGFAKVDGSEDIIEATSQINYFEKQYNGGVISPVDFSNEKPATSAELQTLVDAYIKANTEINTPKVTAKIDFILLNSQPNYKEFVNMESVGMGDGVDVYHPILDVDLHARVISYEYDSITEQYTKLEIGSVKANFIDQIVNKIDENNHEYDDKINLIEDAQQEASNIIKNPGEGHVVIYPSISNPQEILIMDTTDVKTAQNLWRFNEGGLAFSRTGYNGTYELAMTNNGAIVADRITTGTLKAITIIGATISGSTFDSSGKDFDIKIENGKIQFIKKSDKTISFTMEAQYPSANVTNSVGFLLGDRQGSFSVKKANEQSMQHSMSFSADDFSVANIGTTDYDPQWSMINSVEDNIIGSKNNASFSNYSQSNGDGYMEIAQKNNGKPTIIWIRNGGMNISLGNFSVTGTKNSAVQTQNYGERLLNAYETPEYLFATYGKAMTNEDGYVEVEIEPIFLETINTDSKNYHVFVSPYENSNAYACFLEVDRFMIKSDKPNIEVSWQLVAYRKGYEEYYLETPLSNGEKTPNLPAHVRTLDDNIQSLKPIAKYPLTKVEEIARRDNFELAVNGEEGNNE